MMQKLKRSVARHRWFAWHPVPVVVYEGGCCLGTYWTWLQYVQRSRYANCPWQYIAVL